MGNTLFDSYFDTRIQVIANPRNFITRHEVPSTIHLKRSQQTKEAEAERVNALINDDLYNIKYRLKDEALKLFEEAIDNEVKKHNDEVTQTLSRYVMDEGVSEKWIVQELYTAEQVSEHAAQVSVLAVLDEKIKELQQQRRNIRKAKNLNRRHVIRNHLLKWSKGIPEIQIFLRDLPVEDVVEQPTISID
jgi:cysteinyl-tRNA synthetase